MKLGKQESCLCAAIIIYLLYAFFFFPVFYFVPLQQCLSREAKGGGSVKSNNTLFGIGFFFFPQGTLPEGAYLHLASLVRFHSWEEYMWMCRLLFLVVLAPLERLMRIYFFWRSIACRSIASQNDFTKPQSPCFLHALCSCRKTRLEG